MVFVGCFEKDIKTCSIHLNLKSCCKFNFTDSTIFVSIIIPEFARETVGVVLDLRNARAWIYVETDERSSSSILRKTISEPQTGIEPATFWWPVRRSNHWATKTQMANLYLSVAYLCRTCTWARHLSLGSSMVRASHRSSEGCGFDPRLGLRHRFSENGAWRSFICLKPSVSYGMYRFIFEELQTGKKSVINSNKAAPTVNVVNSTIF